MTRPASLLFPLVALLTLSGCISVGGQYGDARWPDLGQLGQAAKTAAVDPGTWVPLVGAAVLMVEDADAEVTEWAIEEQPLFGDDAEDISNDLDSVTAGLYVLSALAAPSQSVGDKVKGLGVGLATVVAEGTVTKGLKRTFKRQRPVGTNNFSLPSGHAGRASALATLTSENIGHYDWSPSTARAARIGMAGLAAATGWARVEAGKHHASDVLVGNAVGHFIATFMQNAFLSANVQGVAVRFEPVADGGALTVVLPAR